MDASEMNKLPKTSVEEDGLQKKKIELDTPKEKPTDERTVQLHDPGEYYLKD
jgi:hypothetical protein